MTSERRRVPRVFDVRPSVKHERLDDEVIAIDLESGAYFALDDVAADCWSILASGGTADAAVDATVARFDVVREMAQDDVARFVRELVQVGLLRAAERPPVAVDLPKGAASPRPYTAPRIERFDDLEELLVLDPIHEVDEAGWPVTPADR